MTERTYSAAELAQPASPDLFACWWSMIEAQRECCDEPPIHDCATVLHFSGSGASCQVYAKDIRAIVKAIREGKVTA